MASHVLLAACRPDEVAFEDPSAKDVPGGLFTTALIECLRRSSLHDTTYVRLFEMLDLKHNKQHPQCEGTNRDRLLFSVNTLHDGKTTFKVTEKKGKLYVSAGSIHGIVVGTEFAVISSTQTQVLKAKKVGAFETMLEGSYHNIPNAEAIVSHWHQPTLRVHSSHYHSSTHVTVVPANEPAEVALHQNDFGKWKLERFDPLILGYSDRFVHFDAEARRMRDILEAIANFNSYLYRSDGAAASFAGKVKIRLNRIGDILGEYGPVGGDLLEVPTSSHSGVDVKAAVITDLKPRYSLTLENFSEVDLFPYFFYFDPSDYSVQVRSFLTLHRRKRPELTLFLVGVVAHRHGIFHHPPQCVRLSEGAGQVAHHRCSHSDTEGSVQTPSSSTSPMNARPTPDSSRYF